MIKQKDSEITLTFAENTVSPFTFALYFLVASLTNLAQRTVRSSLVPIPFPLISDSLGHTDRETENTDRETPQADHPLFV